MKPQIAVVTVSGKAYYLLVRELKLRNADFLSFTPDDEIPFFVKVVLTTSEEHARVAHRNVIEFEESQDPAETIDRAIRTVKGKQEYERLIIGVDPGQNFGLVFLGDGKALETKNCTTPSQTAKTISSFIVRTPSTHKTVRIGNGAPPYADKLFHLLDAELPRNVVIEKVKEEGSSQPLTETSHRRGERDIRSALEIAQRKGRVMTRRPIDDT